MRLTDYTKKRKSTTIRICPKCGRKGLYRHIDNTRQSYDDYRHAEKLVVVAGIPFIEVTDYCSVNYVKKEKPQEVKR